MRNAAELSESQAGSEMAAAAIASVSQHTLADGVRNFHLAARAAMNSAQPHPAQVPVT